MLNTYKLHIILCWLLLQRILIIMIKINTILLLSYLWYKYRIWFALEDFTPPGGSCGKRTLLRMHNTTVNGENDIYWDICRRRKYNIYASMASKLIIQLIFRVHPDHLLNGVVSGCTCWLTWVSQLAIVLSRGARIWKTFEGWKKTNAALCGPRYLLWISSQYEKLAQFNDVPS